jgi:hypothetical protein
VRPALRVGPDGQSLRELVIEITQRRRGYLDAKVQQELESKSWAPKAKLPPEDFMFRGGCTLLIDLKNGGVRYAIVKDVLSTTRLEQQRRFLGQTSMDRALELTYLESSEAEGEPFAALHRG